MVLFVIICFVVRSIVQLALPLPGAGAKTAKKSQTASKQVKLHTMKTAVAEKLKNKKLAANQQPSLTKAGVQV